jgi:hypothetical protein
VISILHSQKPSELSLGAAYQVTTYQRDELKKNHPVQYADMLELVIAGKVVIITDDEKVTG